MRKVIKVVTAGEGGVGKTSLLNRYISNTFYDNLTMTIGVQFFRKDFVINDVKYEIIIWDFGGQEQFRTILSSYIQGSLGALFMFDLSNITRSLRNLDVWWSILNKNSKIPIILIGTKSDLIDKTQYLLYKDLIQEIMEKYNFVDYIETSSKTGQNVDSVFEIFINKIIDFMKRNEKPSIFSIST